MANSVDPDQMPHLIWVYTVCKGLSVLILRAITVVVVFFFFVFFFFFFFFTFVCVV